jgi:hypothetical protein
MTRDAQLAGDWFWGCGSAASCSGGPDGSWLLIAPLALLRQERSTLEDKVPI